MGQRVSGQASTLLAGQEILHLKLNPKVQQHIRKNTPLEPFLSQLGADYILTPNLCIICTHWHNLLFWTLSIIKILNKQHLGSWFFFCCQAKKHLTWWTP